MYPSPHIFIMSEYVLVELKRFYRNLSSDCYVYFEGSWMTYRYNKWKLHILFTNRTCVRGFLLIIKSCNPLPHPIWTFKKKRWFFGHFQSSSKVATLSPTQFEHSRKKGNIFGHFSVFIPHPLSWAEKVETWTFLDPPLVPLWF